MLRKTFGLILLIAILSACTLIPTIPASDPTPGFTPLAETDTGGMPTQTDAEMDSPPAWVVVERSRTEESDQPTYAIQARWPNLEGDPAVAVPFNTEIDRRVNEAVEAFLVNVAVWDDDSGESPTSTLTLYYMLTYESDQLVSVYLMFDTYIAYSAHPFPSSQSLNYAAPSGQFLVLADLFTPEVDPLSVILSVVEPALLAREIGYTVGVAETVLQTREHWNLLPDGLRINFDVYEVGPYAAGHQDILIPWEDLAPYLDPDGPVSSFIK